MKYPVMEYFYSVQGEGFHAGTPAFFIRLGGCDVGCVWCDVKESWDPDAHPLYETEDLVSEWRKSGASIVILTGGEPAMYDLRPLTTELKDAGAIVHIETSGAYALKGDFDWVTLSPKKFKAPIASAISIANELKVVVFNKSDFLWAEKFELQVPSACKLYLQPEWDREAQMKGPIFNYVLQHPHWRISLQTHKYLGVD
ncbi:4Fe-4S cluster-binding domain-containing protein [bacterium]|nr:4Fe-4S cluster-binding domain-containing protein [bacterium]